MKINPNEDGITHINIYSKGLMPLGRKLSNFTRIPMITEDGPFESIEGYWYWLLCCTVDTRREEFRNIWGFKAKELGRLLNCSDWPETKVEQFQNKIKKAILIKINHNSLKEDFVKNKLPFDHYYVYGGKVVKPKEGQWIVDFFNELRIANNQG